MINIEENKTSLVRVFTGIYKNVNANKQKKFDNQYQATTAIIYYSELNVIAMNYT